MTALIKTALRAFDHIPLALLALLARVVIGLVFFRSGLTKIDGFALRDATFVLFATEFKVPLLPPVLAAYLATTTELTIPMLLWAGFATRFAATALLGMTLVIQTFVYPDAYMTHGLWAIALLLLMKYGAGALSIDHFIGLDAETSDTRQQEAA